MAKDEVLRARVDDELAERVRRWADDHDSDVSETIRIALRDLITRSDKARAIEETMRVMQDLDDQGFFEPPEDDRWKAGGFK